MNIIGAFCDFYNMERFAKLHGKSEPWLTHAFATDQCRIVASLPRKSFPQSLCRKPSESPSIFRSQCFFADAADAALGPRLASSVREQLNRDSLKNRIFKKIFIRLSSCLDVPVKRMYNFWPAVFCSQTARRDRGFEYRTGALFCERGRDLPTWTG